MKDIPVTFPITSIPIGTARLESATDVFEAYRLDLITQAEARMVLGFDNLQIEITTDPTRIS